jgi:hypothetical protein
MKQSGSVFLIVLTGPVICLCFLSVCAGIFSLFAMLEKGLPPDCSVAAREGIEVWSSTGKEYIQTIANKLYREMQDGEIYRT